MTLRDVAPVPPPAAGPAPDEIVIRFDFQPRLFSRALMGWWRSAMPPGSFLHRALQWAIGWFLFLMLVVLLGALGIEPRYVAAAVIGTLVFLLGFVVLQRLRMRQFVRVIGEHWALAGETEGRFGAAGVRLVNSVARIELGWDGVDAVAGVRGATVLRSGVSMIAIPDAALPAGLAPRAFRNRLEGWKTAALHPAAGSRAAE